MALGEAVQCDVMLAGGIVLKSAKSIERAQGQLVPSAMDKRGAEAAKAAWNRSMMVASATQVTGLSHYIYRSDKPITQLEGTTNVWSLVKFKIAGNAQGQLALVDTGRHPDIKQALYKALGSVVKVLDVSPLKSSGHSLRIRCLTCAI